MNHHRRNKFAIVLIVFAALAYVANLAIDNPYTHSLVNYYLNEKFLKQLPVRAEYQSMRLQLLPPEIQLFGVRVTNKLADQSSNELISSSQITFKVGLWSLFLAKPQIGDLELHDLNATWPPPADLIAALKALEPKNANQPETPAAWPPKQDPPLSSLTIHNAALRFKLDGIAINAEQDPKEVTWITTEGTELQLDFRGWREIKVAAVIQRLNVADRGTSYIEDANLSLSGSLVGGTFSSNQFAIDSQRINATGSLNFKLETDGPQHYIKKLTLDGDVTTHADFSILGSFIDLSGTRGRINAKAHYNVGIPLLGKDPATLAIKAAVASENAAIGDFHLYQSESDLTVDMDGISFDELRIKSEGKTFGKGKGRLSFSSELAYNFTAKPDGLPLDMLLGVFNVPFDFLNFKLNSQNLEVKGRGQPFHMTVSADSTLRDFALPTILYDHEKFPKSPECRLGLIMDINSKELSFDGTKGICRSGNESDSGDTFPLAINGFTSFNDLRGMDLSFESPKEFNPAVLKYFTQTNLSGSGSMKTRVHGPYSKILVNSDLNMDSFNFGKAKLGRLSVETEIRGDELAWKNLGLDLAPGGGAITSKQGSLRFDEHLTTSADIHAHNVDHGTIESLLKELAGPDSSLSFNIKRLDAKWSGKLLEPLRYKGDTYFELTSVLDAEREYATAVQGQLKSSSDSLRITDGRYQIGSLIANYDLNVIRQGQTDPRFMGGIGLSKNDQVELNLAVAPSPSKEDQILRLPFVGEVAKTAQVNGIISGSSKLTGTLTKLSGLAKVQIDHMKVMAANVPSVTSTVLVDGFKLDIMAEQGGNALKGRVNLDLGSENIPYNWYLTTKNFDFRPFMPGAVANDPRNFAYFSGSWSMQGMLKNWWASTGEIEIKRIRAKYHPAQRVVGKPVEITTAAPTKILISPKGWGFADGSALRLNSDFGFLSLGFGNNHPPTQFDIITMGNIKVEALKMFSNEVETASGNINFKGGLSGSLENPNVDILFSDEKQSSEAPANTWEPVAIGLAGYRPALKDIQLRARLRNNSVQIETLRANKGTGSISMDGTFAFPGAKAGQTDLNLTMENASFVYPFPVVKNFDTTLNANIRITGQNLPLQIAGLVNVKRARSNREIDIRQAILDSIRSSATQTGPQSLLPSALFDIRIAADESIIFNSRNAQATLSSTLHLSGSDVAPEVSGLIEVNRGRFFYKRDFNIQRGLINFDDPVKPDPSLDISALSDVGGYRVSIGITGKASAPIIDFTVDPPNRPDGTAITKLEIITLLNRGSLPEIKANGNTSTAESTAAAEALNLLAGQVEDTVEKIFDISGQNVIRQVYIDTYATENGPPIARFNLPLNISENLDVILKADQNTVQLTSEYALHEHISVTGSIESINESNTNSAAQQQQQQTPADTGVDIKFKFAFP